MKPPHEFLSPDDARIRKLEAALRDIRGLAKRGNPDALAAIARRVDSALSIT
jgi:hypothetical protein